MSGKNLAGEDALFSIVQMPPGVPVATVAIDGGLNAAILASRKNSGSPPAHAISFTHMATASMPMVSCLSRIIANFTFVPHPSVPDRSTGSSISLIFASENARMTMTWRALLWEYVTGKT